MGETREDSDAMPAKMEKSLKKNKTRTNDLQYVGDKLVEINGALLTLREKKRKSETIEDGDEDQDDKGNLLNDGDLLKKDKKKKKRKRDFPEKAQIKENELGQDDEPAVDRDCDQKVVKKKTNDGNGTGIYPDNCQEDMFEKMVKKKKTAKSVKNNKVELKAKGKSKKVSFSGHVEVFPSSDTRTETDGLVQGKRFTPEEDEIIKEAVFNFIAVNNLGDNGLEMVLNCKKYPGLKKCWQDIATCIPYRTVRAVYYRGHILFERAETCGWTPEEIERLKELHKKYGKDWKKLGQELGKHRFHVKDAWRRIKLENKKTGRWSQEEYQNLYDLVNLDLQMKINGEKRSKHGMLRDNIPWTAISEKLSTRTDSNCCIKWYDQLTSSLVAEKKWSDTDDYRMIGALYELDAACVEDVDWDNLLKHRPGDICRKRWDQMVKHIGHQGSKPFAEQVDTLAKRYCPDLADTREAWDNKPLVP